MSTAIEVQLARLGVFETVYPDWYTMVDEVINSFQSQGRPWRRIHADLCKQEWSDHRWYLDQTGNLSWASLGLGPPQPQEMLDLRRSEWRWDIPGVVIRDHRLHISAHALQRFEQRFQRCWDNQRDILELLRYTWQVWQQAEQQPDRRCWVPFHDGLACMQYDEQLPDPSWAWLQPHSGQWHDLTRPESMHYTVITFVGAEDMGGNQFFDWWKRTEDQNLVRQRYLQWCEDHSEPPLFAV